MYFLCVCMHMCTNVCLCALCICCIRGDAALCLPQWSIWKAVREMNDCRYIDYCFLPLCHLLPLSFLSAPFSFPPPFPITSSSFLYFSSISTFPAPPFPLSPSDFSPLYPCFSYLFSISQNLRPCHHITVCERAAFRKSRHHPLLKDSLPSGAWIFKLALQS